jgi:transposase
MPSIIKQFNIDNAIKLYLSGMSVSDAAKRVGINSKTADKYICNAGFKRTKAETSKLASAIRIGKPRPELLKPIPECVINMYINGGTVKGIAAELNTCSKRVSKFLSNNGVIVSAQAKRDANHGREKISEWAKKASKAAKESGGRKNPHEWAKTRSLGDSLVGEGEIDLIHELSSRGVNLSHQFPVGSYNIDIAINELNIAIEVHRGSWGGRSDMRRERIEHLLNSGWRIIYVQISRWGAVTDFTAIASNLITYFDFVRQNPTSIGQYGVLRRNGNRATGLEHYFYGLTRIESL